MTQPNPDKPKTLAASLAQLAIGACAYGVMAFWIFILALLPFCSGVIRALGN